MNWIEVLIMSVLNCIALSTAVVNVLPIPAFVILLAMTLVNFWVWLKASEDVFRLMAGLSSIVCAVVTLLEAPWLVQLFMFICLGAYAITQGTSYVSQQDKVKE